MIVYKIESIFKKIINSPGIQNIAQAQISLRYTEILHRFTYVKRFKRMAEAIERYKRCKNKKPISQIRNEINLCRNYWGCYPLHYFRYNLYRNDKQLSERELLNYIPEFFFYYLFIPFYNLRKFENYVENKNISEQIFRRRSIIQPPTLCKLINGRILSAEMKEIEFGHLEELLQKKDYKKLFVKPVSRQGGYGIFIFHRNNKNEYLTDDGNRFNKDFLRKIGCKEDYIIQPGLEQDLEISKIFPHSLNTVRILTENKNGNVRTLYAIFRMGRGKKEVDNTSQNGIFVDIDLVTGEITPYAISHQFEYFDRHPDTNFIFKGYKILNWFDIKKLAIENANKLSEFTYLAWDIALTKDGLITIEANAKIGLDGHQIISGGLREIYQINNPNYYWENKGKRIC